MIALLILTAIAAFYFMAAEGKRIRIRRARARENRLTLEYLRAQRAGGAR